MTKSKTIGKSLQRRHDEGQYARTQFGNGLNKMERRLCLLRCLDSVSKAFIACLPDFDSPSFGASRCKPT